MQVSSQSPLRKDFEIFGTEKTSIQLFWYPKSRFERCLAGREEQHGGPARENVRTISETLIHTAQMLLNRPKSVFFL